MKPDDNYRAANARVEAMDALKRMGLLTNEELVGWRVTYKALKRVLGYPIDMEDHKFCVNLTINDIEALELLAGPHGYAIYKMLEVRLRRRIKE